MAMQALVAARVGIAVIPRPVASMAVRDELAILPLASGMLTKTVSIVSRREGFSSNATTTMRALLHDVVADLASGPLGVWVPAAAVAQAASPSGPRLARLQPAGAIPEPVVTWGWA